MAPKQVEAEDRAERLRVLFELHLTRGSSRDTPVSELSTEDLAVLEEVDETDMSLFRECLVLESELRGQAYDAVARLLSLVEEGDGDVNARILRLPDDRRVHAAAAAYDLGWVYD